MVRLVLLLLICFLHYLAELLFSDGEVKTEGLLMRLLTTDKGVYRTKTGILYKTDETVNICTQTKKVSPLGKLPLFKAALIR